MRRLSSHSGSLVWLQAAAGRITPDSTSPAALRQEGEVITDDYPGEAPHRFTGGAIKQVAIDVSGEAYVDLEREAALMLMRE